MVGSRAQIRELFGAHVSLPAQTGNHDRPGMAQFLAFFIAKWNGPAAKLVEPLHRIDQMSIESVTPHFSVGQHVQAIPELEGHGLIDGAVFQSLEFRIREPVRRKLFARFLKISRTQQAADNISSIHTEPLSEFNPTSSDVGDGRKYTTVSGIAEYPATQ